MIKKNCAFIFFCSFFLCSCASQMIPSGGKSDLDPPQIIESYPNNNTVNYKDNFVRLSFNEFVELENPLENILISPFNKNGFKTKIIGKSVYVYFLDSMLQNKTYSISFSKAIKDYTEGNILKSMTLRFSTGPKLDTNKLKIYPFNVYSSDKITKAKVVIAKDLNDFIKGNYSYIAKQEDSSFVFDNLDERKQQLFAFVDSNTNNKWDMEEFVGFYSEPWPTQKKEINIPLFISKPKKYNYKQTPLTNRSFIFNFVEVVESLSSLNNNVVIEPVGYNSYLLSYNNKKPLSTIPVTVNKTTLDTLFLIPTKNKTTQFISQNNIDIGPSVFIADSISLSLDQTMYPINKLPLKVYEDTNLISVMYQLNKNRLELKKLRPGKSYKVLIDSGSMITADSMICNKMVASFKTFPSEMIVPQINIYFDIPKTINQIVCLYNLNYTKTFVVSSQHNEVEILNIPVGAYQVKMINDLNNNGIWDTGDIYRSSQPEPIVYKKIEVLVDKECYSIKR